MSDTEELLSPKLQLAKEIRQLAQETLQDLRGADPLRSAYVDRDPIVRALKIIDEDNKKLTKRVKALENAVASLIHKIPGEPAQAPKTRKKRKKKVIPNGSQDRTD